MTEDNREGWIRWEPGEANRNEMLKAAVEEFEPPCKDVGEASAELLMEGKDAGEAAAKWLMEESLADHPHSVTWVLYNSNRVQGFFAICSSSLTVTLPAEGNLEEASVTWPCSKILWLCKREGSKFDGRILFRQAAARASEVARLQGNVALVIEPYDDGVAERLISRHKFIRAADQGQLWLPLQTTGE